MPLHRFLLAIVVAAVVGAFFVLPLVLDRALNRVVVAAPYRPSVEARALYDRLFVADLHADSLLWGRDLGRRHAHGHVDIPRLLTGRVALQAFTIVTKAPWGLNIEGNDSSSDMITLLAVAGRWPRTTWTSLLARALYQAERLERLADGGRLVMIRTAEDLAAYRDRRRLDRNVTGALLGVEGAHALEGDLANLDTLFDAGVRMMAPTHFFDNEVGGSAHGVSKGGLTELGAAMIARMEELGMALDLAHASPRLIDDALAVASRPVVISHTGVRGTCDNTRNLSDDHVRAVAAGGGIVGIGYWKTAVCGTDAAAIARAIRHVADLTSADHVALGSDFDGAVATPFDAGGLVELVDALLTARFSADEIARIMGENVARVFSETLPAAPARATAPVR